MYCVCLENTKKQTHSCDRLFCDVIHQCETFSYCETSNLLSSCSSLQLSVA